MTSISSLKNIHKKGLFGDHQNKDNREIKENPTISKRINIQNIGYQDTVRDYRESERYQYTVNEESNRINKHEYQTHIKSR